MLRHFAWVLGASFAGIASVVFAADGSLDPEFGLGGVVEIPWAAGSAQGVAIDIDSNGRIIVAGSATGTTGDDDFTLFRLLPNGSLDTTFASNAGGFRQVDFGLAGIGDASDDRINALSVLADGSVVAVGEAHFGLGGANSQFAIAKTDANGNLDATFHGDGTVHFGFDTFDERDKGQLVSIDANGHIDVCGSVAFTQNNDPNFIYWSGVARLTPQGQLDNTFYGGGRFSAPVWADTQSMPTTNATYNFASSLILDGSQRIVVTARIYDPFSQSVALLRTLPDGTFDSGFGESGNGRVLLAPTVAFSGATYALANGRLMVSGVYGTATPNTAFLQRLDEDGRVDMTFASNGLATTSLSGINQYAFFNFLAPTKSGGWVLSGSYGFHNGNAYTPKGLIVVKFHADGSPDETFGPNGIVAFDSGSTRQLFVNHAALQQDGKLVVAGTLPDPTQGTGNFAVLRILVDTDTIFASGFETAP